MFAANYHWQLAAHSDGHLVSLLYEFMSSLYAFMYCMYLSLPSFFVALVHTLPFLPGPNFGRPLQSCC